MAMTMKCVRCQSLYTSSYAEALCPGCKQKLDLSLNSVRYFRQYNYDFGEMYSVLEMTLHKKTKSIKWETFEGRDSEDDAILQAKQTLEESF